MLKMQPEKSEVMKINNFHSHLRKDQLRTFSNTNARNKQTLEDVLNKVIVWWADQVGGMWKTLMY